MAIPDSVQTLSAAFSFGILLQAATGALFVYYRSHGATIFQDGRRLVLVLFLLFAALWAQMDFINLLLPATSSSLCQGTLVATTIFDQLARVGMEQFLLWSVGHGSKVTAERLILQGLLSVRLVVGGVLVGFTRPQFDPVCVAEVSATPVSAFVLILDAVIITLLMIRALSLGMFRDLNDKKSVRKQEQSRALILSIVGLGVWTATSVPMILGFPTIFLLLRTVLPANGLLILVGVVTMFPRALLLAREESAITPEARSPFVTPLAPSRDLFRESTTGNGNGSPISNKNYGKSGSLYIANPSSTPRESPIAPRGDTRGFTKLNDEITVQEVGPMVTKGAPGYRGSSGIFPTMISASRDDDQAALAPQIRKASIAQTQTMPGGRVPNSAVQQKRPMFPWSKSPVKPSVRAMGISGPLATSTLDENTIQPFARIQTIDLATAAANERERRDAAAARARYAPQPSVGASQEQVRASISIKRKEPPRRPDRSAALLPALPDTSSSTSSKRSFDATDGSTTSVSLSPGREEVRRRSPRTSPKNSSNFSKQIVDKAVPTKPPLQRKGTIGLPSNPKSQRLTMAAQANMAQEQTVMFINNIVYDNPGVVNSIIDGAPKMIPAVAPARSMRPEIVEKSHFSTTSTTVTAAPYRPRTADKSHFSTTTIATTAPRIPRPNTAGAEESHSSTTSDILSAAGSIIHRPRPYKRDTVKDRALWPSEPSPGHKRSKSGSSVVTRKSMLMSAPGSPTRLPPLPSLPPTSAANLAKLLPNNTKSMTFDEKIEFLFPAPPKPVNARSRRSSVPSLPRVPSVFMSETPVEQSPTGDIILEQSQRASKRSTIGEFQIPNIETAIPADQPSTNLLERQTYRFSANTYRNLADEVGEAWTPMIPPSVANSRHSLLQVPQRQSVMNDIRDSSLTETTLYDDDDITSYWGSVHSEIPPVDLTKVMRNAQSTFISRSGARADKDFGPLQAVVPIVDSDGDAIMTVMLDSEENRQSFITVEDKRQSVFFDDDQTISGIRPLSQIQRQHGWHRRIGDELPTFSERSHARKSRKMPPPTPLLLNTSGRQATVVVRGAEPSPPTDSPERAIQEIQEQLKKFEEPSRGSVGSLLRGLPGGAPDDSRMRLLETLEKEMGEHEDQWQQMHEDFETDSVRGSIISPRSEETLPRAPSRESLSRQSSHGSSLAASRALDRRARIPSSMTIRSKGEDTSRTASTSSSDNSRASVWQQRLAQAQAEYMDNAPALLGRKQSINFLHVNKRDISLGSPTPPESVHSGTDVETESESENGSIEIHQAFRETRRPPPSLWEQAQASPKACCGRMWNPRYEDSKVIVSSQEPPAQNIRPVQRYAEKVLPIFSTDLWSKPASAEHSRPVVGLWGSRLVRPKSIVTRRATQKPQRKSKRVTFLPDIVESPQPLPNKRDTLGIFQFPWGEKSDQPTYQPAFDPALLAGPVAPVVPAINANLDARSRELESSEHSSSFFDDYDEGDSDDDEILDPESDDDFDESTLWEIANLLNSNDVPSKQSIMGVSRTIVDNYDGASEYDSDDNSNQVAPAPVIAKLPIQPLVMSTKTNSRAQLWSTSTKIVAMTFTNGLPQPSTWNAMVPASDLIARSKPRSFAELPVINSKRMWAVPQTSTYNAVGSSMWVGKEAPQDIRTSPTKSVASSGKLWTPHPEIVVSHDLKSGLFSVPAIIIRTTQADPAALEISKAPRQTTNQLPTISSQSLWTRVKSSPEAIEWISKSSVTKRISFQKQRSMMWSPEPAVSTVTIAGLFDASVVRFDYRQTKASPAAINMICKPRITRHPLSKLTSTKLWHACGKLAIERDWISESTIRPESPSVYSTSSSGRSSPVSDSDASSYASSIKSTSTKASSIWSNVGFKKPSWWDSKRGKREQKDQAAAQDQEANHPSKIPVRTGPTSLTPVRESRVLASRDIWGSSTPDMDRPKTPSKQLQRQISRPSIDEAAATSSRPKTPTNQLQRKKSSSSIAPKAEIKPTAFNAASLRASLKPVSLPQKPAQPKRPVFGLKRPVSVSRNEWDEALNEAIAAGLPRPDAKSALKSAMAAKKMTKRVVATTSEWDQALSKAVRASVSLRHLVATTADWEAELARAVASSAPKMSSRHRVVTSADWQPALLNVITSGAPKKTVRQPPTPGEWEAALADAVASSAVTRYDPSVLHPVFFTEQRTYSATDIHPAMLGYVSKPELGDELEVELTDAEIRELLELLGESSTPLEKPSDFYDSSMLHPVFFTDSMVSSSADIHPAALGYVTTFNAYDPSTRHPVFFASAMVSTSTDIHPAATGYVSRPSKYDASILHPVFFGGSMISTSLDIHPAAIGHVNIVKSIPRHDSSTRHPVFFTDSFISGGVDIHPAAFGYVSKAQYPPMWTQTPTPAAAKLTGMWSKSAAVATDRLASKMLSRELIRKALPTRSLDLPVLQSTNFWQPSDVVQVERNWLYSAKAVPVRSLSSGSSSLWSASPITPIVANTMLWSKGAMLPSQAEASMKLSGNFVRKGARTNDSPLSALESKSFWMPIEVANVEHNWISASAPAKAITPAKETSSLQMWAPEDASTSMAPSKSAMWSKQGMDAPSRMELHGEPLPRASTSRDVRLPVLESFNFWQPTAKLLSAERDWTYTSVSAPAKQQITSLQNIARANLAQIWSPLPVALASSATKTSLLWSRDKTNTPSRMTLHGKPRPRNAAPRNLPLPVLSSSSFWRPNTQETSHERNWISFSSYPSTVAPTPMVKVSSGRTWTPPSTTPIKESNRMMWTTKPFTPPASPDMFAHIRGTKKQIAATSRPELPRLDSGELFSFNASGSEELDTHWLHETCTSAASSISPAKPLGHSMTWTAPAASSTSVARPSSSMWDSITNTIVEVPSLFANPHSEPWTTTKREAVGLSALESSKLWCSPRDMPASSKNWIVERRFSKVEFRY